MPSTPLIITNHFLWNKNQEISKYHEPKLKKLWFLTIYAIFTSLIQLMESWNFVGVVSKYRIVHTKFGINIFSTLAVAWFCHIFTPHLHHFTPTRAGSGMGAPSYFDQRLKIYYDVKFHASSVLYIMVTKMTKMLFYHLRHSRH